MKTMKNLILIFLFCSGCFLIDNSPDCMRNYLFEVPIKVSPNYSTLKLGDTLTVSMQTDNKQIYDRYGDRYVYFPNFDPNITFLLANLDSLPAKDGLFMNEVLINSDIYNIEHLSMETLTSGLFFIRLDTTNLYSKLDFSIVINTTGTYALYPMTFIHINQDNICFPDKCDGCGPFSGTTEGIIVYDSQNNQEILTEYNQQIEEDLWKERPGGWAITSPYYFYVID